MFTLTLILSFSVLQLKERGYIHIDAIDGSIGMIEFAKSKNIYTNYFHVLLGPKPINEIDKGYLFFGLKIGVSPSFNNTVQNFFQT